MQRRLECPICEARFDIDSDHLSPTTICPECKREFAADPAMLADEPKSKRRHLILPEEVHNKLPAPSLNRAARRPEQNETESDSNSAPDLIKPLKRTPSRKPGRFMPLAIILLLAVIAGSLLAYLPYVLKQADAVVADKPIVEGEDETANLPGESRKITPDKGLDIHSAPNSKIDPNRDELTGVEVSAADQLDSPHNKPQPQPQPAPPGGRELFSQTQIDRFWGASQSRIVRLEITDSLGNHPALATIVDSRGWIVTSFRAVVGASRIRVIQTRPSFAQFKATEPLSDLCRGVIVLDPEHDLAILSINRRFVIDMSDLKIANTDEVRATTPLVQFVTFDDNMPLTTRETKVMRRSVFSELGDAVRESFDKTALDTGDLKWILHRNTEGAVPGAPLFTIDGELVGINSDNRATDNSFAVPAELVSRLLTRVPSDTRTTGGRHPLPIEVLSQNLEEIGMDERAPKFVVGESSPIRDSSVAFNVAAKACLAFNWQPKNDQDYDTIREFAMQLLELSVYADGLAKDQASPSYHRQVQDREQLQTQIDKWQAEMLGVLTASPPRTEKSMDDFNQAAIDAIHDADPERDQNLIHMAYLNVSLSAMDSPKVTGGTDTITLGIQGTGTYLNVPYSDQFPSMLPETTWLTIFAVTDKEHLHFNRPRSGDLYQAKRAELLMIRGPLK